MDIRCLAVAACLTATLTHAQTQTVYLNANVRRADPARPRCPECGWGRTPAAPQGADT